MSPVSTVGYCAVQLALMMAEKAADKNQKQAWQNQAVRFAADIEATHGPYWGRLADIMMVDVAKTSGLPSNIQMLVRLSDEYLRKKQFADAIDTLDSAADLAIQQESPIAFSIAYRAAILLQQQKQFDEASQRLRILAHAFPIMNRLPPRTCWLVGIKLNRCKKTPKKLWNTNNS